MKTPRMWLRVLSPALAFLAARFLLTTGLEQLGMGEKAGALSACLMLLPVVYCFVKLDRGAYLFAPIRPLLPWAVSTALLLLIDGTLLRDLAPAPELTLIGVLGTALCAPVCEELVYRGLVCSRCEEQLGFRATLVISSVLFGIAHTGLQSMAWAAVFGAVFYLLRCSFDTLLAPIAAHMILNLAAFLL